MSIETLIKKENYKYYDGVRHDGFSTVAINMAPTHTPEDEEENFDCPFKLLDLVNKPAAWRMEASKLFIKVYQDMHDLRKDLKNEVRKTSALIAILVTIAVAIITVLFK